ncbi:NAD(P)/FAD-dependent oxidoreductase [Melittangium boletus]|uniref:NAD(P)/FAD-dependent oxidoreductase n=1 Tax=Melittangium boletus TaxID=83453 RepID=UPI003DA4C185
MAKPVVIVVGAGLAGLTCARMLQRAKVTVRVLEASDGVGGRVRTDVVEGFRLDRGFQVLLTAYPEPPRWLDYAALDLQRFFPGARVRRAGRFHQLADPLRRPLHAARSVFTPVGSLADKLHVLDVWKQAHAGEVEDVFLRPQKTSRAYLRDVGFSDAMVEAFFQPFFGGIFLEKQLRTSSRMLEFVFRMFSSGATAVPARGMGELTAQLAGKLPQGSLHLNTPVEEVFGHRVRLVSGAREEADAVVVATDGRAAEDLLPGLPPRPTTGVTGLYFAAPEPPVRGPHLVLNGEGHGPVNNLAVMSEVSPAYAPAGQALVSVSVLETGQEAGALEARVREQLTEWFGAGVAGWRLLRTYALPRALPLQTPEAFEEPHRRVRLSPGLYACGDYRENGSIDGAMVSGRRAAEALLSDLELPLP